jgi:hypothetical protein
VPALINAPVPLITPSNVELKLLASPMVIVVPLTMLPDPDKLETVRVLAVVVVKVAPLFTVNDLMVILAALIVGILVAPLLITTSVVVPGTVAGLQFAAVAQAVLVPPTQVVCASKGCNCVNDNSTINIPTQNFELLEIVTFFDNCFIRVYILCFIKVFIKKDEFF